MTAKYRTISGPEEEPISLEELKAHMRVEHTDEDDLITAYGTAAREFCEQATGRLLISQTCEMFLDQLRGDFIRFPVSPIQSVRAIQLFDNSDVMTEVDLSSVCLDLIGSTPRIVLRTGYSWPSVTLRPANGVRVEFIAGYGSEGAEVPERLRQAVKLIASHWYIAREAVTGPGITMIPRDVPLAATALLRMERVNYAA